MTKRKAKTTQTPRTRIVGTAREQYAAQAREQYDSGMSVRAIAAFHGRSYGNVHKVLTESGVTFRSRGGARS